MTLINDCLTYKYIILQTIGPKNSFIRKNRSLSQTSLFSSTISKFAKIEWQLFISPTHISNTHCPITHAIPVRMCLISSSILSVKPWGISRIFWNERSCIIINCFHYHSLGRLFVNWMTKLRALKNNEFYPMDTRYHPGLLSQYLIIA